MSNIVNDHAQGEINATNVGSSRQKVPQGSRVFARLLAICMTIVGLILFIGGLIAGIILTVYNRPYGNALFGYGSFFDRHEYAIIGIPLMSSALTFGLPFAAIGSYMYAKLQGISD